MFRRIGKALRFNVLLGLLLVTPLVVTLFIVQFLFNFLTQNVAFDLLTNLLPEVLRDTGFGKVLAQVLALIMALMVLFLIGFFVRSFLGKRLYNLGERVLGRIPVFNKIYLWVRQISEGIFAQRQTLFQDVVLVEYPRRGVYSIGFVTAPTPNDITVSIATPPETEVVSLFIPTTPNPTSGMMIMAPRGELTYLSISVQDAMKFVISAGAVAPGEDTSVDRPTLIDKIEGWLTREARGEAESPPG